MITKLPIRYAVFIPCVFCFILAIPTGFSEVVRPVFLAFLPICFFQVAILILRQQREIQQLRELVDAGQAKE